MSDDPKLPMPNLLDKAYLLDKFREGWLKRTPKHSPAPSPQPSRSTTPAPSNRHAPAPGETAMNPYAMITVEIRPRKEVIQLRLISQILCSLFLLDQLIMCMFMVGLGAPEARVGNAVATVEQVKEPSSISITTVFMSQIPMQRKYNSSRRSLLAILQHSINLQIRARVFVHLGLVWKSKRTSWSGSHHSLAPMNISSGSQA
ncbi:hypothetical protein K438DRAFT_1283409 [Mycena galopus ATCC 62051]|nr:hypothetical protein K438DRAFT_1283409 [Mycena galopus ATCC 62051]